MTSQKLKPRHFWQDEEKEEKYKRWKKREREERKQEGVKEVSLHPFLLSSTKHCHGNHLPPTFYTPLSTFVFLFELMKKLDESEISLKKNHKKLDDARTSS